MKVVAEFVMRGRPQALMVSVGGVAIPGFSWLGSAVVGLITLRRGWTEGAVLLAWAVLPAIGWLMVAGEPVPFILLLGTAVLATVLRVTVSWSWTLIAAVVLSLPTVWILEFTSEMAIEQFVAAVVDWSEKTGSQGLSVSQDPIWLERFMVGLITAGQLSVMLATLVLARWWQSQLFNPGGFGQEFRGMRLNPAMTIALVAAMLACYLSGNPYLSSWLLILTVPLVFYGIALTHWFVNVKKLGSSWLLVFYMLLLFFMQFMMPLLVVIAVLDSLIDLRRKKVEGE